jgi:MFS family permease
MSMAGAPPWVPVLVATFGMQVAIVFATLAVTVVGPPLTAEAGLAPETIGYLIAVSYLGTVLYLLVGSPVIPRFGPARVLQAGAVLAGLALLLSASGVVAALFLGALLIGLGNGPTVPAGSRILARTVPPAHRTLIFSVKQAGAPLGGILAGLLLPPVALAVGWQAALLLAGVLVLIAAPLAQPLRRSLDADRDRSIRIAPRALLARDNLAAPFAALASHSALPPLVALCVSFAVVQACLLAFVVSFLTTAHGYGLAEAGLIFAWLQVGGFLARIGLAWLADRTRAPIQILLAMLATAAMSVLAFTLLAGVVPFVALAALALLVGISGNGWQGIVLAEIARLAPPDRLTDATAGATICAFVAYFVSPMVFAMLVGLTNSWSLPMLLVGAQAGVAAALLTPRLLGEARANPVRVRG